jgi:chromosome segregation ATPase
VSFHTWPRRFSASRLALALWLCGSCVQCSPPLPASEVEEPLSTSVLQSLTASLQKADASLTALESLWPKLSEQETLLGQQLVIAQQRLETLRGALQLWRENSDEWERLSQDSQAALRTAQISLAELTKRYEALSQSWSVYREASEARVALLDRRVRGWRTAAIAGTVGALAAGFLLGFFVR